MTFLQALYHVGFGALVIAGSIIGVILAMVSFCAIIFGPKWYFRIIGVIVLWLVFASAVYFGQFLPIH